MEVTNSRSGKPCDITRLRIVGLGAGILCVVRSGWLLYVHRPAAEQQNESSSKSSNGNSARKRK